MTAPDARTAAQAEARRHILVSSPDALRIANEKIPAAELLVDMFTAGAVWGAALVTPTRETLVSKLYEAVCDFPTRDMDPSRSWTLQEAEEYADAVLALMRHPTST